MDQHRCNETESHDLETDSNLGEHISTPNKSSNTEVEIGMEFATIEDAESFYAKYAKDKGFAIIRRNSREKTVQFFCYKEGMPRKRKKPSTEDGIVIQGSQRATKSNKVGCRASLFIVLDSKSKMWRISRFVDTHNHDMVSPNSLKFLRRQRKCTNSSRSRSLVFDGSVIPVGKVPDILYSVPEVTQLTHKDCYNYLGSCRNRILDVGDAQSVYLFCSQQQELNPGFRYAIQLDEDDKMKNFFWVDARSRNAYEIFGEVVSFDMTYKTNKYNMPFASFVGIDNHMHSMLFGFAFLQDQTEEAFVWLFNSWLHAMNGKHPLGFITDEDMDIINAVAKVFPTSRHRICLWHITKKFSKKLLYIYREKPEFKQSLNQCIYKSLTIDQFEQSWMRLVQDFNLSGNEWLMHLYSIRHLWVPVFSKDLFFGGMDTTSCSESINSFFDTFVHSGTTLKEFVDKYGQAIDRRYETIRRVDFDSRHKVPILTLGMGLEEHAGTIYTSEIFKLFHAELSKILSYSRELMTDHVTTRTYRISNRLDKGEVVLVEYNMFTHNATCECKLFESIGILCRHICLVLFENNIERIPPQYVFKRWTKDVGCVLWEHPVARGTMSSSNHHGSEYKEIFDDLTNMGNSSDIIHEHIMQGLHVLSLSAKKKFEDLAASSTVGSSDPHPPSEHESRIHIGDSNVNRMKGRKKQSEEHIRC